MGRIVQSGAVLIGHSLDPELCWCECITIYTSQATGQRLVLHRMAPQIVPPAGLIAAAKVVLDAVNSHDPADHG